MIESGKGGRNEFKLSLEEEELIRKSEEQSKVRKSCTAIPPIEFARCLTNLGLSLSQFDTRGDKDFSKSVSPPSEIHVRGGFQYFKPTYGQAYGLNIGSKAELFGEWAVGFHGVRNETSFVGILKEGLRAGPGQGYASQKDYTGETTVPTGVYFSPNINVCLGYVNAGNPLILQCLINPSAIRTTTSKEIWVVGKTEDIVPYRIISYPMPNSQRRR